jgi:pantoate--beta-alanine ligase
VFGQKDVQQCVVIRRMVTDLLMPIDIAIAPTERDPDGLAMSSRNRYLSPADRQKAPILYQALTKAERAFVMGERSSEKLTALIMCHLDGITVDYVSITDPKRLDEIVGDIGPEGAILSATIRLGGTRLLDNMLLGYKFN